MGIEQQPSDLQAELNPAQRSAAGYGIRHGESPAGGPALLIIAGAGSGKTHTLAHRAASLILGGLDPGRLLLLTFTRRAAAEMTRRTQHIVGRAHSSATGGGQPPPVGAGLPGPRILWSGTFHGIANRLLRIHAESVGLDPSFTVLDRSDSADLMNWLRNDLGLSRTSRRFPRKTTCLAIYSHATNSQLPLEETLDQAFPWCRSWPAELRKLFGAYVEAKQERSLLDYDDLLLYWYHMMADPPLGGLVRERFDHVLVDEYQDTNALQAQILLGLKAPNIGLTVVGDDAQSIYSFRAATVRNILDFPKQFDPPAPVIMLEQSYRSTQPILAACNAVIGLASERFTKNLFSSRESRQKPILVTAEDETAQVEYVVERVLEHREAGIDLRRQAVLFRASHHSDPLEVELGRRNIPFVKYGGLKFLEAAHVKDMLCVLRWVENPRDTVAAFRVLQLLPGFGPVNAQRAIEHLQDHHGDFGSLSQFRAPTASAGDWPPLCSLLQQLRAQAGHWPGQLERVRGWYQPHLERLYDAWQMRAADLEQLEQISASYPSRERFLTELTLDPPDATADQAGAPWLDEDFLILSTIHSAKGQEWDVVYVLNTADGCIPSDMATGHADQIEEERRLLYVAMTRARDHLHLVHPQRFFKRQQQLYGDSHVYTPRTRFIPDSILDRFELRTHGRVQPEDARQPSRDDPRVDVASRLRERWHSLPGNSSRRSEASAERDAGNPWRTIK